MPNIKKEVVTKTSFTCEFTDDEFTYILWALGQAGSIDESTEDEWDRLYKILLAATDQ